MTDQIKARPVALVTGGSRGLGRAMALHLAREGADVVLTYQSRADAAAETVAEIEALGGRAAALPLDTREISGFDGFAAALGAQLSGWGAAGLDILVLNAGIGLNAPVAETGEEMFDTLFAIHVKGVFFLAQRLLPVLKDGGRVLAVSTGLTRFCMPGYAAYAAAKGAVEVFARYLAVELGPRGISVNVLAPGAIETDFGGGMIRDNAQVNAHVAGVTALGRVGLPDDIGAAAASLLMSEGNWITGQRIEVSGGMKL
ncbi:SDR family NAD(P)-dependent oxidoreductase [Poseidonocella sp. HB161398]|uniref:SDR family NAD(P)-dependent oxidoreductase n=1 Tax=Poseidonocella sp. HB161398 TaxID=2320855 RepID=UPI001109EF94|nr:SDR family oxidoreductase [Poseidonocella sp. HB161398]